MWINASLSTFSTVRDNMQNRAIIKQLKITGFKSIEEINLQNIGYFMVLAGANGSGKSNFVDALYFLSLVLRFGIDEAVRKMGGIFLITSTHNAISYITYHIIIKNNGEKYQYDLKLHIEQQKSHILYENLIKTDQYGSKVDYIQNIHKLRQQLPTIKEETTTNVDPMAILIGALLGGVIGNAMKTDESDPTSLGALVGGVAGTALGAEERKHIYHVPQLQKQSFLNQLLQQQEYFFQVLNNVAIYRIDADIAKRSRFENQTELHMNGDNLIAVLTELEKNDELRETILEWLALIVPEMQKIQTYRDHLDGANVIEFLEESGKKFPAHLVSDGTIYALCMLVAILTRTQKAGITIIEEPERGLHPKAIGELIGFMREHASINHPIILTTHSESVVRELELDELFFISKENGKTKIKSVKNSVVDKNKIPLDTAWLTNMLNGGLPW